MEKESNEVILHREQREERRQPIGRKKKTQTFTSLILVVCEKADKSLIEAITEP